MNEGPEKAATPTWQSTLIALALILLVGGIFVAVFEKSGVEDALKVWAALGTVVGVVAGAVPAYFFGKQGADAAREDAARTHAAAASEAKQFHADLQQAQETTANAQAGERKAAMTAEASVASARAEAEAAEKRAHLAEEKLQTLLSIGRRQLLEDARTARSDLTW